jgi:hypothetical protein
LVEQRQIRGLIRLKVESGALPCDFPAMAWGWPATVELNCAGCGRPIMRSEFQMEVHFKGRQPLSLHVMCTAIWEEECRSGWSAPPTGARRRRRASDRSPQRDR